MISWSNEICKLTPGIIVAIDGKTIRRSFNTASKNDAIHLLSAWASKTNLVLGQQKVDGKTNEITQIPKFLKMLELSGAIVTIDAMGCQKEIAKTSIEDSKADYVLALKANHKDLHNEVCSLFNLAEINGFNDFESDKHEEINKGHGRIEKRSCSCLSVHDLLEHVAGGWTSLNTVVKVDSSREIGDNVTTETRYCISSLPCAASTIAHAVRAHWGIENSLHWVLDVVFREDESRIRKDHSPENFATIQKIVFNLIKLNKSKKMSTKRVQFQTLMTTEFAGKLLFGI